MDDFIRKKTVLITGGTGSIGKALLDRIIKSDPKKIIIFSRDEYKQFQLKLYYGNNKRLKFVIGDVRDLESITTHSKNVDVLFHCAALKHVPISEENPEEFIKTNIIGAINVRKAALNNKIPIVISISTDKTVNPTNVMGLTKAIQEKIFSTSHLIDPDSKTKFVNVRFGNVVGTKGSLFPVLRDQIEHKQALTMTSAEMTRFLMTKQEAVELILRSATLANDGETVVRRMKSTNILKLFKVFARCCGKGENYPVVKIGISVGEKIHESLISEEEYFRSLEKGDYIIIRPYHEKNIEENLINSQAAKRRGYEEYTSNCKSNFMTDAELERMIRRFLKQNEVD